MKAASKKWGEFKRDAKALADSVERVFRDGPMSTGGASAEQKKKAQGMAGQGGLNGRRRDSARDAYVEEATGSRKPKPRGSR